MMNVYVAGKMTACNEVRHVQKMITDRGGNITFDWTGPEGKIQRDWHNNPDGARKIAETERDAVEDADLVIVCNHERGLGMYVELGMALAQRKEIVLYGKNADSVFFHMYEVQYIDNEQALREFLDEAIGSIYEPNLDSSKN